MVKTDFVPQCNKNLSIRAEVDQRNSNTDKQIMLVLTLPKIMGNPCLSYKKKNWSKFYSTCDWDLTEYVEIQQDIKNEETYIATFKQSLFPDQTENYEFRLSGSNCRDNTSICSFNVNASVFDNLSTSTSAVSISQSVLEFSSTFSSNVISSNTAHQNYGNLTKPSLSFTKHQENISGNQENISGTVMNSIQLLFILSQQSGF